MRRIAAVLALALLATCTDRPTGPVEPGDAPAPTVFSTSQQPVVDGANGGDDHFYFLPPLVPQPTYDRTFYDFLNPVVQVCRLSGDHCTTPLVAEFTTTTGPGSETVRVVPEDEHYIVNWHTGQFGLQEVVYRVAVLMDGSVIGYADVQVVGSAKDAAQLKKDGGIAIVNGRTLPIKFRIEGDRPVVIDPEVLTLISDDAEREAGLYRFRILSGTPPTIGVRDVIVGTESGGFLRRVTLVVFSASEVTLETEPASLNEIVATGSFQTTVPVGQSVPSSLFKLRSSQGVNWGEPTSTYLAEGVGVAASGISLVDLDLCAMSRLCPSGVTLALTAGQFSFDPDIDLGGRFSFFSLEEFHAIARGTVEFSAGVRAVVGTSFMASGQQTIATFSQPFVASVGPIPIAGAVELSFVAGFTAEASAGVSVESGMSATFVGELGGRWENGGWSTVNDFQRAVQLQLANWNASANIELKVHVRPEISVRFYGVLGPFMALEPYLLGEGILDPQTCLLQILTGLDAEVGIEVQILSKEIASLDADFAGPQATLAHVPCQSQPVITFETYPNGSGVCGGSTDPFGRCDVTDEFSAWGVEFDATNGHPLCGPDPAALINTYIYDPPGAPPTNWAVTNQCSTAVITMRLIDSPRSVTFDLTGNHSSAAVYVVRAYDDNGSQLPNAAIQRQSRLYATRGGHTFRTETITVLASSGVQAVEFETVLYGLQLDNVRF